MQIKKDEDNVVIHFQNDEWDLFHDAISYVQKNRDSFNDFLNNERQEVFENGLWTSGRKLSIPSYRFSITVETLSILHNRYCDLVKYLYHDVEYKYQDAFMALARLVSEMETHSEN